MTKCISHHLTLIFLLQIIQVVSAQPLFLDSSEMAAGKNLTLLSVCLPHHPPNHPQPDHNALLPIPSPWSSQCTMRQRSLNTMQRISAATAEEESATLATSGVASSSDQFPSHEAETNKKLPKCIECTKCNLFVHANARNNATSVIRHPVQPYQSLLHAVEIGATIRLGKRHSLHAWYLLLFFTGRVFWFIF